MTISRSTTTPHQTSIAVWDIPSPVIINKAFSVKVGVKCSAACDLTGQLIVVRNEAGGTVGEGRLGETPWPGTSALYEVEVNLGGLPAEGMHSWFVTFAATESTIPHKDASATFSFRTVRPPEHGVTVTVIERDTDVPLKNAQIRLGIYRASTNECGQTSLEVPTGRYDLNVRKIGYETHSQTLEVTERVIIRVTATCTPDKDLDDEQVWM